MIRVLYINDNPTSATYAAAFHKNGLEVSLIVAKTVGEARGHLSEADSFDIVFMDFDMGQKMNTVDCDLVKEFLEKGFGGPQVGAKMLVANTRDNIFAQEELMHAGCNYMMHPSDIDYFIRGQIVPRFKKG